MQLEERSAPFCHSSPVSVTTLLNVSCKYLSAPLCALITLLQELCTPEGSLLCNLPHSRVAPRPTPSMREAFFARLPVGGAIDVAVPPGRLLVLTQAALDVPHGTRLAAAPGDPPPVDWVALSCAKAAPTAHGLPEFHTLASLAWPGGGPTAVSGMSTGLHIVLDDDASLAAEWARLSPQGGAGGRGGTVGGGGALPGVSVHVAGYLEDR